MNGNIKLTRSGEFSFNSISLAGGTWYAKEIIAPDGYIISDTGWQKMEAVNNTDYEFELTVTNEIDDSPGKIRIIKVDEDGKQGSTAFDGIKFYIYSLDGNGQRVKLEDTVTIDAGTAITKELPLGKYEIVEDETLANEKGYKVASPIKITLSKPSTTVEQKIQNIPKDKEFGSINIIKKDEEGKKLPGAKFKIEKMDSNGNILADIGTYELTSGEITITNLELGTYKITETESPADYELDSTPIIKQLTTKGEIVYVGVTNKKKKMNFTIVKADIDTEERLKGAKFKIFNDSNQWLGENNVLTTESSAKEFETNANGEIKLTDIPNGEWYAIETYAPENYRILNSNGVQLNANDETIIYNVKDIDLQIKKVDSETNAVLSGAGFTIYNKDEGKYVDGNGELTSTQYVHITDGNGLIRLTVPKGNYTAREVIVPKGYIGTSGTIEIVQNSLTTVYNTPKYIDIEGTVFLDGRNGKTSVINNVYDEGEGFNGIKVTLKRNGKVVANVASGYDSNGSKTGIDGHYKFIGKSLKIREDDLSEYTIEFEYNGLQYTNVALPSQITAGGSSKAAEKASEREAFNARYSTVTANTKIANGESTNKANGGDTIKYKYNSEKHTSQVIYQTTAKDDKGNPYDNVGYADDQYHITSYTTEAKLDFSKTGQQGGYPYDPTKDSIVDINFGLTEREHPDVAISSDLAVAETSINGYTQIYPYQKRYDQIGNDSAFTVEVKSSDAYYPSYQRNLYKSDVQYTKETSDGSELAVYLTYKVSIKNQSSSINVTVNDIVDYFSKDVIGGIVAGGTDVNTLSEIPAKTNGNRYQVKNSDGIQYSSMQEDSGYSKQYITLNKEIKTGEKYEFYVQYRMTTDAICKTIEENLKFNNVFELNTVSAKTSAGKVWTAVDKDSAVGNCVPSDRNTMEDDTDYAPGIDVKVEDDVRKVTGIVFEDKTSNELKTGEERKGNGQYDAGEKGIKNATVQLIDIDRGGQIAYSNTNGTDIKSNANGIYTINGFIPGNYIIKYTYGNGTDKYTAQQYKSTIYVDQARATANYANGYHGISTGNPYWYQDEGNRKSDAIDNYNGEMQTLYDMSQATVNKNRTEIEKLWQQSDGMQHILNGTTIDKTIAIDAFTPHMAMTVEKQNSQEGAYAISNVDFGIVERPRYKVQIEKTINRIQLIQADGSVLRDFTDFNNPPANTKAIKSKRGITRGFVQFEIDTELLQTTTLLVEYKFTGTNISEIEYQDEAYYKYGIVPQDKENKIVKLSIANVIDYVDNELMYTENVHMIQEDTNKTNKDNGWSTIDLSKNENKKYVSEDVQKALYGSNGKCAYNTILISNGLDNGMLKPNESRAMTLLLNKTLSPSKDEMRYENLTEVVEVKKTWGRELSMEETKSGAGDGQILGNLDPTDPTEDAKILGVKDPDTHYSETIIINPPTGSNQNTIIVYTILGIVSLAILATGIVIIKKKVLD